MTVDDAAIALFKFFTENDVFRFEEHFSDVVPVSIDEPVEKAVLEEALRRCEAEGIVCRLSIAEKPVWNLNRPLEAWGKELKISAAVVDAACSVINQRSQLAGSDYRCNPFTFQENDLARLAYFASTPAGPEPKLP